METPIGMLEVINTTEGHIIRDVSTLYSYIDSNTFPFDTITRQLQARAPRTGKNIKHEWPTVKKHPRADVTTAAYAGGEAAGTAVTLSVANAGMWRVKDAVVLFGIANVPAVQVQAVDTANGTITVKALSTIGAPGATPGGLGVMPAIPAGTVLGWFGNIQEEGFTYSAGRAMQPVYGFNFQELCDLTISITGTRKVLTNYGDVQDWERMNREQFKEHRRTMELKQLFQIASWSRSPIGSSASYQWTMNGVQRYITKKKTYAKDATNGSRITEIQLIDWLVEAFADNVGSRSRFFFVDAYLSGELDKALARTKWTAQNDHYLGVKAKYVSTSQGDLFIVHAPLFNEIPALQHYGLILDMEVISKVPLIEMYAQPLKLREVGIHQDAVQLIEQSTIEVLASEPHMEIQGVIAGG